MSLKTKLFYALSTTSCRWRFSYGRKPKGKRLENTEMPSLPDWIEALPIPDFAQEIKSLASLGKMEAPFTIKEYRPLEDLFEIHNGHAYGLNHLQPDPNGIAFISRTSRKNGISGRVKPTQDDPSPAGVITVALSGSVLEAFLQNEPTYQGFHIAVLTPKTNMTAAEKLWYVTVTCPPKIVPG